MMRMTTLMPWYGKPLWDYSEFSWEFLTDMSRAPSQLFLHYEMQNSLWWGGRRCSRNAVSASEMHDKSNVLCFFLFARLQFKFVATTSNCWVFVRLFYSEYIFAQFKWCASCIYPAGTIWAILQFKMCNSFCVHNVQYAALLLYLQCRDFTSLRQYLSDFL